MAVPNGVREVRTRPTRLHYAAGGDCSKHARAKEERREERRAKEATRAAKTAALKAAARGILARCGGTLFNDGALQVIAACELLAKHNFSFDELGDAEGKPLYDTRNFLRAHREFFNAEYGERLDELEQIAPELAMRMAFVVFLGLTVAAGGTHSPVIEAYFWQAHSCLGRAIATAHWANPNLQIYWSDVLNSVLTGRATGSWFKPAIAAGCLSTNLSKPGGLFGTCLWRKVKDVGSPHVTSVELFKLMATESGIASPDQDENADAAAADAEAAAIAADRLAAATDPAGASDDTDADGAGGDADGAAAVSDADAQSQAFLDAVATLAKAAYGNGASPLESPLILMQWRAEEAYPGKVDSENPAAGPLLEYRVTTFAAQCNAASALAGVVGGRLQASLAETFGDLSAEPPAPPASGATAPPPPAAAASAAASAAVPRHRPQPPRPPHRHWSLAPPFLSPACARRSSGCRRSSTTATCACCGGSPRARSGRWRCSSTRAPTTTRAPRARARVATATTTRARARVAPVTTTRAPRKRSW